MKKNILLILVGFILCLGIFYKSIFSNINNNGTKKISFEKFVNNLDDPRKIYDQLKLIKTIDKNNDGQVDGWLYSDTDSSFQKFYIDLNCDGKIDNWDYIKNKKAFLSNRDTNFDGKADNITLQIFDNENSKHKMISLYLKDREINLFEIELETKWEAGHILVDAPKTKIQ